MAAQRGAVADRRRRNEPLSARSWAVAHPASNYPPVSASAGRVELEGKRSGVFTVVQIPFTFSLPPGLINFYCGSCGHTLARTKPQEFAGSHGIH